MTTFVSNIARSERVALYDIRCRHDIIVKAADKNLGLAFIGRAWYMQKCYRQLHDMDIYQEVAEAAFDANEIKAWYCLARRQIRISGWSMLFKGAPLCLSFISCRNCMDPVIGRPIVASCGWCTTPLSR